MNVMTDQKKIAVTDASGVMGPAVIHELRAKGHAISAFLPEGQLLPDSLAGLSDITYVEGDVLDLPALEQLFADVDLVVHTANLFSLSTRDKARMRKINIEGTFNVVNLSIATGVEKLIHLSSTEALGHTTEPVIRDENSKWDEHKNNTVYGRTMFQSELQVWRGTAEGLSAVILRPSHILGGHAQDNPVFQWLTHVMQGATFFPTGKAGWVDALDVARAVELSLLPKIEDEAFIISAGNFTYKSIMEQIVAVAGLRPPVKSWPNSWNFFLSLWEKGRSLWTGDRPWITPEGLSLSQIHAAYDGTKAKDILGLQYRSISDSIQLMVEAYHKAGRQENWEMVPNY
jgi:nucleoside-diphosphate-sugar epimerase